MANFTKFNQFTEDLAKKVHNLNADTLKIALSNVSPVVGNTVFANITEIAAGNGYTAGGATAAFVSGAQTVGTYKLVLTGPTFTATGGSIAVFQYAVLYNDTPTSPLKPLIAFLDYGAALTVTNGNAFAVSLNASTGTLTIV